MRKSSRPVRGSTIDVFKKIYHEELLKRGWDPESEKSLIELIDQGTDLNLIYYATILLRDIGTPASIPALKKAMGYRKADVKITALWTISAIAGEAERGFYLAALLDKNYREKMTAIQCISRHCGEEAADAVAGRVEKLLPAKRPRIAWNGNKTELTIAVTFIARFAHRAKVKQALARVASRWESLHPKEREQLASIDFLANR